MEAFFVVLMALSVLGVGVAALVALRAVEAVPIPEPLPARPRAAGPRSERGRKSGREQTEVDSAEATVEIVIPASWRKSR